MEATNLAPITDPQTDQNKTVPPRCNSIVVNPGKVGLRFGPVVTGQVALGKDGCGY